MCSSSGIDACLILYWSPCVSQRDFACSFTEGTEEKVILPLEFSLTGDDSRAPDLNPRCGRGNVVIVIRESGVLYGGNVSGGGGVQLKKEWAQVGFWAPLKGAIVAGCSLGTDRRAASTRPHATRGRGADAPNKEPAAKVSFQRGAPMHQPAPDSVLRP